MYYASFTQCIESGIAVNISKKSYHEFAEQIGLASKESDNSFLFREGYDESIQFWYDEITDQYFARKVYGYISADEVSVAVKFNGEIGEQSRFPYSIVSLSSELGCLDFLLDYHFSDLMVISSYLEIVNLARQNSANIEIDENHFLSNVDASRMEYVSRIISPTTATFRENEIPY